MTDDESDARLPPRKSAKTLSTPRSVVEVEIQVKPKVAVRKAPAPQTARARCQADIDSDEEGTRSDHLATARAIGCIVAHYSLLANDSSSSESEVLAPPPNRTHIAEAKGTSQQKSILFIFSLSMVVVVGIAPAPTRSGEGPGATEGKQKQDDKIHPAVCAISVQCISRELTVYVISQFRKC